MQSAASIAKGEIELPFDGKVFAIKPNFEIIASIEGAVNQSARSVGLKALAAGMSAAERGLQPEISLTELTVCVFWMLKDQGGPDNPGKVGAVIMDDGYADLLLPVGQFLTRAQRGHKLHQKEAEEAEEAARKAQEAGKGDAAKGPTATAA